MQLSFVSPAGRLARPGSRPGRHQACRPASGAPASHAGRRLLWAVAASAAAGDPGPEAPAGPSSKLPITKEEKADHAVAMKASAVIESRTVDVFDGPSFDKAMADAAGRLVVLEIQSDQVCESGLFEEAEVHWKREKSEVFAPCVQLRDVFAQAAADCPDVTFLRLTGDGGDDAEALCARLGVTKLPTLQFYRGGKLLWQKVGASEAPMDLGEGVMFFGGVGAGGVRATDHVIDLAGMADVGRFVNTGGDTLSVVMVALSRATSCLRVYPAALALARNMAGQVAFARLVGDESEESMAALRELNVSQVPTFIFFRGGKETGRHIGSSKGDLIGQILLQQGAMGVSLPPPPPPPLRTPVPRTMPKPPPAPPRKMF